MELGSVDYLAGSVQDSVQSIVRHFNVDYFTLHLFRGGDDAKNTPYVRTNYPDAWVSRYLLHDYVRIDPDLSPKFPPSLHGVLGVKSVTLGGHFVHVLSLHEFHRRQVA